VEVVPEFAIDLSRVVVVKATERQTVVQLHATVRHIQCGYGNGVFLAEGFAQRNVERGVLRQIRARILRVRKPVCEPRPVVHIRRSIRVPGKTSIETEV